MTAPNEHPGPESPPTRVRVAQALAFVALAAALLGALGPAERVRTTYSWPPATLPNETPERTWYTPLLLASHRPDAISATLPCTLAPALRDAANPNTVLATARRPEIEEGLAVSRAGDRLRIAVGLEVLDRVDVGATTLGGDECAYRVRTAGRQWSLENSTGEVVSNGRLERPPVVTGLFSSLDLRSEGAPSVEVTTAVHATRTTTRQAVAWVIAALACAGALLLVSVSRRSRRPWAVVLLLLRGAREHARAPDVVVAVVLAAWWIISPAYFDDGWVTARERMFSASRGFPTYYSTFGVNFPLDYWIEWLHHWIAQSTLSLVVARLPAVLCLAMIWVLCRWMVSRILRPIGGPDAVTLWTLASVFSLCAVAWGITLRPEPVTALFVTGVMACMVRFMETRSIAAVAVASAFLALALSAHPAGVVALAAMVVASPRLVRWVRPNAAAATAIFAAALAMLALLLFVGADVEQRRSDAQITRTYGFNEDWRDELMRYTLLVVHHYGTPLRRISVLLIGLAALGFLLRRRRAENALLDFPGAVLIAGLVLLIATPSKWPSHFGTLIGVVAVAFCCEVARVRREAARSDGWRAWPFVAVAAAALGVAWAWLERQQWNVADLRTLDWTPGFEAAFPIARLSALLPLLVLAGALLAGRIRRRERLHAVPWRVASGIGLLVAVPVLVFTSAMIVVDTARTSSWTLGRQNLATLGGGDVGCGLADDLLVPVRESARSLPLAGSAGAARRPAAWMPETPVAGLRRYALGPTRERTAATPWYRLPRSREFGIFITGAPSATDVVRLEWGTWVEDDLTRLGVDVLDATVGPLTGDTPWRFVAAGDLPTPPDDATAVRVTVLSDVAPGAALAVTAPVTYSTVAIADRIAAPEARTLVLPNLLMYVPCARLPLLDDGVVEAPDHIISWSNQFSPFRYQSTSPFLGVVDVYDLVNLPTTDSELPPMDVIAYDVDRLIPGAVRAAPESRTVTS